MTKKLFYLSIIANILLFGAMIFHWKYIGLRYDLTKTPPLNCYQLGAGYIVSHEDVFKNSELTEKQEKSGVSLTPEQAKAFRQSVFVQDTAEAIERLCNQEISDYTLKKE